MIDWIAIGLQLLASAMSLAGLWKIDDKSVWGQGVSLVAQVPWLVMNIYCGLWGLLPLTFAFAFVNARNFIKWRREAAAPVGDITEIIHNIIPRDTPFAALLKRDAEHPSAVRGDHEEMCPHVVVGLP